MAENNFELPAFPEGIPTSIGETHGADGSQNMCLQFCVYIWYGERWRPWGSTSICGASMEEIQSNLQWVLQQAAARGFQCRAEQGGCPSS